MKRVSSVKNCTFVTAPDKPGRVGARYDTSGGPVTGWYTERMAQEKLREAERDVIYWREVLQVFEEASALDTLREEDAM